jgi:hypothetical protein
MDQSHCQGFGKRFEGNSFAEADRWLVRHLGFGGAGLFALGLILFAVDCSLRPWDFSDAAGYPIGVALQLVGLAAAAFSALMTLILNAQSILAAWFED